MTASRPGSFSASARSVVAWPTPYFFAASCVLSSSRPTSEIDLDPVDQPDAVEMLEAEGAGAGERDFDGLGHEGSVEADGA